MEWKENWKTCLKNFLELKLIKMAKSEVEGKEGQKKNGGRKRFFFDGDTKLATKNIPADAFR